MIDCFLFGVSKTFPFTGFEYIGWLNGGGGDGGVDTLTFLFPSFWLGTNTTETKVFLIFSPYNVSNIICRRIFQNDEIVDFCCSKSVEKAQKVVKNVEICKKL